MLLFKMDIPPCAFVASSALCSSKLCLSSFAGSITFSLNISACAGSVVSNLLNSLYSSTLNHSLKIFHPTEYQFEYRYPLFLARTFLKLLNHHRCHIYRQQKRASLHPHQNRDSLKFVKWC